MTIIADVSQWSPTPLHPAVAVIGSGPAGIAVARDLASYGLEVIILESGDLLQSERARALNDGEVDGARMKFGREEVGLMDVRMRAFGGSSGHWNGMCRPLETSDFDERPELGRPGWAIERAELEPWYRQAHATCDMGEFGYDPHDWFAAHGGQTPVESDGLESVLYRFSPIRFGVHYRSELESSPLVTVLLDATVTEFDLSADGRHVRRIVASSSSGEHIGIEPEMVVVATGGIETPRLLLESGLANSSGLVGCGFMEHPHVRVGRIALSDEFSNEAMYRPIEGRGRFAGNLGWAGLSLKSASLRERSLIGGALTLEAPYDPIEVSSSDLGPGISELMHGTRSASRSWFATLRTEQLASPSRVITLGTQRSRLGHRLPRLHWSVDPLTVESLQQLLRTFAVELGKAGLGRLEMTEGRTTLQPNDVEIGCHHMGTTRMSLDPRSGVVDQDCFTHDVDNLCIIGSSVFPTSGYANPTLTIVALAHRLAAELAARLD